MPHATWRGRVLSTLIALLVYLGLVCWLSWPLASHLATHLPYTGRCCTFDRLQVVWALAWESRALVTDPARFAEANIYFPAPHALFYGWTSFGALPYFFVPFLVTGNPILAVNVTFLVSLALAAWTLHLVVHAWGGSHRAAFVASWTLLTTFWTVWGFPSTAQSFAVIQYFPLIIYMASLPASRLSGVALLVLVVLQGLTNIYTAAALLGPFTVVTVARLVSGRDRRAGLRLLAVLVGAVVLLVAAYSGHLVVHHENPALRAQTYWGGVPTESNPLTPPGLRFVLTPGAATAVPMAALFLIALGAISRLADRNRPERRIPRAAWGYAAAWAVTGMFLSQRPVVDGWQTLLAWPLATLGRLVPVYELIRSPERLGVAGLMGLAILAGLGMAELATRWRRFPRVLDALVVATAIAMYLGVPRFPSPYLPPHFDRPYPLMDTRPLVSSLVPVLRTAGGPVVELPAVPDPWLHSEAMFRSIFHGQPLLNGYASFWPAGFRERMALADRLPDPDALAELRRSTGLAMVLVHGRRLRPTERARWLDLVARGGQSGLRLVARDDLLLAFAVEDVSPPARASAPGESP